MSNIPSIPSSPLLNTWLRLSARLLKECQASDRWEDASQILTAIIGLGPLDETVYFTHEPSSIVEFHLRRPAPETPCSKESLFSAARIFLAKFKKNPHARGTDMERVGKALMLEALSSQHFNLAHRVYWRILGWAEDAEAFTRWAMETYFERKDYKNVLKVFSIHYSRMKITAEHFDGALDCVAASVEALNGLRAEAVLDSFLELECPADTKLRVRWLTTLLRSHWARYQDPYQTAELFRKVGSLMLLNKIDQPQIIYVALVEILVNAGNEELAQSHANRAIREYPDVASTLALKLVLFKAKAGDWDGVIETLHRVQRSQLANPASYDASFIPILKIWAESHSAAETRDFVLLSMRDLGLKFHRFMVTLVANKYGEARDMEGFTAWLQLVSQEGFALDPGFCNSILYNCWATWKFSYPELRMIQKQFEAIIPDFADEVTPRIMSQAVHRERKRSNRTRPKAITVNKMAYSGRSVNKRDIYEAMTQELMNNKPAAAGMIYRRALKYGMPFCGHCLRLAVLAAFRRRPSDSGSALSMIREAHSRGHEISPALSTFIKCEVDAFSGGSAEMIIHMRDIINRLESSRIAVRAEVLTHMAAVCSRIGHHERAIVLCNLARDRLGSSQLCYSRQSFKALATAYTQLMDVSGLEALIDSLVESKFSADKASLLHLKSIGRLVRKAKSSRITTALLEVIENGIYRLTEARFEARTQGKQISQEALRIVGDALVNMNLQKNEAGTVFTSRTGP
ncbi:hypothetical protein GGR50DRAFT_649174 [Xylaria sp. CBS 124048]|nr:hypothetical protein GGR50DRAFT_649174 [Xylaria sp. CBS 124048]